MNLARQLPPHHPAFADCHGRLRTRFVAALALLLGLLGLLHADAPWAAVPLAPAMPVEIAAAMAASAQERLPVILSGAATVDLGARARLFLDESQPFPHEAANLPGFLRQLAPADKVNLLGGSYWWYAELRNDKIGRASCRERVCQYV